MAKGKGKSIKKPTVAKEAKEPALEPQPLSSQSTSTDPPPSKREWYSIDEFGAIECLDCKQQAATFGLTVSAVAKLTGTEIRQEHFRAIIGKCIDIATIKHLHSLAGSLAMLTVISHDMYQHMSSPAD
jgi:hypothetical protein